MKLSFFFSSAPLQSLLEKSGWHRMSRQEQRMVAGLIVVVTAILIFHFLFSPLLESRQRLQKSLVKKNIELQQMHSLQQEYRGLQFQSGNIQERIRKRPKSFTLFSYIEKQATGAKVKSNIKYLKPSEIDREGDLDESRVDMKLQRITTASLVNFLKGLESEDNVVFINRISIQEHGKDEGYLNVVIQVITFKLTGET
ncbi:MAG: type II secretion system protein M [Desulfocapsa sp.]|nr:type II secretion system protein M [Desulfocapsa sp.]MBN4060084.1 type II secretion system protein M [Desulfotalea psychrophila]